MEFHQGLVYDLRTIDAFFSVDFVPDFLLGRTMSLRWRLMIIGFVAPIFAFTLALAVWGIGFLVLALFGYPIMVVFTLASIFPLHRRFVSQRLNWSGQIPLVFAASLIGGVVLYIVLFFDAVFVQGAFSLRLLLEYCGLGIAAGTFAWVLYNFGPFRVPNRAP